MTSETQTKDKLWWKVLEKMLKGCFVTVDLSWLEWNKNGVWNRWGGGIRMSSVENAV